MNSKYYTFSYKKYKLSCPHIGK